MNGDTERERRLRREMVRICRALHRQGAVAGTDGNVSARLGVDRFLVTPGGRGKGLLTPGDLVVIDGEGNKRAGAHRPTSESRLHLAALDERPDARAVIHAHPPAATAFSLVGESLPGDVHPEMAALEGEVPLVPYATPGSPELVCAVRPYFSSHDSMLLENHGLLCLGTDPWDALWRLERIEQFARSLWMARGLGRVRPLPPGEPERLAKRRSRRPTVSR